MPSNIVPFYESEKILLHKQKKSDISFFTHAGLVEWSTRKTQNLVRASVLEFKSLIRYTAPLVSEGAFFYPYDCSANNCRSTSKDYFAYMTAQKTIVEAPRRITVRTGLLSVVEASRRITLRTGLLSVVEASCSSCSPAIFLFHYIHRPLWLPVFHRFFH